MELEACYKTSVLQHVLFVGNKAKPSTFFAKYL